MSARLAALSILFALAGPLAACSQSEPTTFEGYGEADYLFISARDTGEITTLSVKEGDQVRAGDALFSLDDMRQKAAVERAEEAISEAKARALLATQTFARTKKLVAQHHASQAQLDRATSDLDSAKARVSETEAALIQAHQDLADRAIAAPAAGSIEEIFRRVGERASPNEPVLALLPPANMKIRFFVPETVLSQLKIGGKITVSCDACSATIPARISFISSEPQYTPPVIYSRAERSKLVYLVEARPEATTALRPGQPLEVSLAQ